MKLLPISHDELQRHPRFARAILPTSVTPDACDPTLLYVLLPVRLPMAPVTHLYWSAHVAHQRCALTRPDALRLFAVLTGVHHPAPQTRPRKLWDVALLGRDALLAWDRWLSFDVRAYPTQTVPHRLFCDLTLTIPGGLDTHRGRLWAHHPNLDAAFRPLYTACST